MNNWISALKIKAGKNIASHHNHRRCAVSRHIGDDMHSEETKWQEVQQRTLFSVPAYTMSLNLPLYLNVI